MISIIGAIIGFLVAIYGAYCFIKEKDDKESRKIYGIISGIGIIIFLALLLKVFFM